MAPELRVGQRASKNCNRSVTAGHRASTGDRGWSGRRDSNSRPPTWKAGALPTELLPRRGVFYPGPVLKTLRAIVDPGLAFGVDLFLPDRHRVLQLVDEPLAGVERLAAMRRRHGDHHADLSHLQGPNPVDHRDA